jgi:signal transduction histidine kinase
VYLDADEKDLPDEYARAFDGYLRGAGESALQRAYEVSREAIASGVGILDVAIVHHAVVVRALERAGSAAERKSIAQSAETFLAESLSPFEMTHRAHREVNTALRHLNERLEDETRRLAHALHDEAGQLLVSVHLSLAAIATDVPAAAAARITAVRGLLDEVEGHLRRISHELRPTILDDLGLLPALEFLAEGVSQRTGLAVTVEGDAAGRLPAAIETALYRIVQEGLTNVTRHAQASAVRIELFRERGGICCRIRDDGRGFDASSSELARQGLGLTGIRERLSVIGGTLQISSGPSQGTELMVTIALEG